LFRDPKVNVRYTRKLFFEQCYDSPEAALYTLKNRDHEGYISLYHRYMETEDPTEITFANTYFEDYEHWQLIVAAPWFKPYIERWRKELALRIRAKAFLRIRDIAQDETDRATFAANKFLIDGSWMSKEEVKSVGRPSKEAIRKEAELLFENDASMKADLERLIQ
jgi:hypothetical protein